MRIEVEVTNLEWTSVGYSVANNFVHRCAARLREVVIVQWARVAIALNACFVNDTIKLVRGNADGNRFGRLVQHLATEFAREFHRFNFLIVQHFDCGISAKRFFADGTAIWMVGIIWS